MLKLTTDKHEASRSLSRAVSLRELSFLFFLARYGETYSWNLQNTLARAPTVKYEVIAPKLTSLVQNKSAIVERTRLQSFAISYFVSSASDLPMRTVTKLSYRVICAHNISWGYYVEGIYIKPYMTLKFRWSVTQSHSAWYHLKALVRFPIRLS